MQQKVLKITFFKYFFSFFIFFLKIQKNASSHRGGGSESEVWSSYLENCDLQVLDRQKNPETNLQGAGSRTCHYSKSHDARCARLLIRFASLAGKDPNLQIYYQNSFAIWITAQCLKFGSMGYKTDKIVHKSDIWIYQGN